MIILSFDKINKFASRIPSTPSFLRDRYFKNVGNYINGEIPVEITKNGRQVAPFVAPEIGGKVMERDGKNVTVYEAPEVAPQRVITRKNVLATEMGNDFVLVDGNTPSTPEQRQAKLIREDLIELDEAITRREEVMCSEVLFKGQVTVIGEGYNEVIQFWDQADKPYEELSGGAKWDAPTTSDPAADIERGISMVQQRSGYTPTELIVHPKDWALARQSQKLMDQLDTKNISLGEINLDSTANEQGVRVVGRIGGLTIMTYSQTVTTQDNADGTQTPVALVPEGYILFANPANPTEMAYGVVQVNDVKAQEPRYSAQKRTPNMYLNQKNPAGIVVETKCAPLPIPFIPDAFYVIKVK